MIELIFLSSSEKNLMKTKRENKFFLVLLPQLPRHLRSATLLTTQLYLMVLLHWMTCSPLRDGSVTEDLLSALPLVSLNSKMLLMHLMKLLLPLRSRRLTPSSNSGKPEEVTSNTKEKMRHSMQTVMASPLSNLSSQETHVSMRSLTIMNLASPTTLLSQRLTNSAEASPTLSLRRSMPRLLSSNDAETLLSSPAAKFALNSRPLPTKSQLPTKEALPTSLKMLLQRSLLLSPSLPQKMRPLLSSPRDSTPCTSGMLRLATSLQFSQSSPPQLMDSQRPATAKLTTVPSLTLLPRLLMLFPSNNGSKTLLKNSKDKLSLNIRLSLRDSMNCPNKRMRGEMSLFRTFSKNSKLRTRPLNSSRPSLRRNSMNSRKKI